MTKFFKLLDDKWINSSLIRCIDLNESENLVIKITWINGQHEIIRGGYALALKELLQILDNHVEL